MTTRRYMRPKGYVHQTKAIQRAIKKLRMAQMHAHFAMVVIPESGVDTSDMHIFSNSARRERDRLIGALVRDGKWRVKERGNS